VLSNWIYLTATTYLLLNQVLLQFIVGCFEILSSCSFALAHYGRLLSHRLIHHQRCTNFGSHWRLAGSWSVVRFSETSL